MDNEIVNKYCPFCGSKSVIEAGQDDCWAILCEDCYGCGPQGTSPKEAAKKWNKRAGLIVNGKNIRNYEES